jgi:epoxyqueuosine reductase QueG
LVSKDLGSNFRLTTVLTDAPVESDEPLEFGCGSCTACIAACPAKAIKEKPEEFNKTACYEKICEFRKQGYTEQYICGLCVKACRGK